MRMSAALMALLFSVQGMGYAASLEEADALFEKRGELFRDQAKSYEERAEYTKAALRIYKELLPATSGGERAAIGAKITRAYIYLGDALLDENDRGERRPIFKECQSFVEEELNEAKVGPDHLQPYYYGRAACWAFRLKASSKLVQLAERKALENFAYEGADYLGGAEYFGGGIYRTIAGIRASRSAIGIGAGNVEEALEYAERALETPENDLYNELPSGAALSGAQYCENYRYKAQALMHDRSSPIYSPEEATAVILQAIDEFGVVGTKDSFEVTNAPEGLGPDTLLCMDKIFQFVDEFNLDIGF